MKQQLRGWLAGTTWLLAAATGACGSSSDPAPGATTGGATTAGSPSTVVTTPMSAAGTTATSAAGTTATSAAGTPATSAPAAAGTPAISAGGTPATAAAGGGAAGGAAAGASNNMACGPASTLPGPMLHAEAAGFLVAKMATGGPCAFGSCHSDKTKKAQLSLDMTVTDLKAALVGKAPCEAPSIKLVDGSGGDAALAKSWLWLKLVAPADASSILTPDPSWGTPGACGQSSGMDYGMRMPFGVGTSWEQNKLDAVKAWICAGAPGPM